MIAERYSSTTKNNATTMFEFIAVMINGLVQLDITNPGVCLIIYILQKSLTEQNYSAAAAAAWDFNGTMAMY